jgi:hypothetical protein
LSYIFLRVVVRRSSGSILGYFQTLEMRGLEKSKLSRDGIMAGGGSLLARELMYLRASFLERSFAPPVAVSGVWK